MIILLSQLSAQAEPTDKVDFPASTFSRGSGRSADETPRHKVSLSPYSIDRNEVSIAEFEQFVASAWDEENYWSKEGLQWKKEHPSGAGKENRAAGRVSTHPVVAVTWFEAEAYCSWKGGQLPTEAQWEQAACPDEGRFPWGSSEEVEAVWYSGGKYGHLQSVLTKPVAEAPQSQLTAEGMTHTVGNVWEWTSEWYHRESYKKEETPDPKGPQNGQWKTLRGGSFMNLPSYCSCTHREPAPPTREAYTIGFRCAYSEGKP